MTLRHQWDKIKENWLLVAALLLFGFFMISGGNIGTQSFESLSQAGGSYKGYDSMDMAYAPQTRSYDGGNFAPGVEERKITKTASMSTEVETGTFSQAEQSLKAIVTSSDSYLINENVNTYEYDNGKKQVRTGYYSLRVDISKYDSVISQLKAIGEIQSFNENAQDITGSYTNVQIELQAEKDRLARYEAMYGQATEVADKIELSDRIFDQERRIKYLEESVENMDQRIDYTTVSMTISEKRSDWADITFVKFANLVKSLVSSANSLFYLVFVIAPYAVAGLVVLGLYKAYKRITRKD